MIRHERYKLMNNLAEEVMDMYNMVTGRREDINTDYAEIIKDDLMEFFRDEINKLEREEREWEACD